MRATDRQQRLRGVLVCLALAAGPAAAQQLNARQYTVADGLGDNTIHAIHQDARGYIWIATYEGLTRFDGYTFKTYDTAAGLPHSIVHNIVEDRHSRLWVSLFRGLVRVSDELAGPAFHVEPIAPPDESYVGGVIVADDGALWYAGEDALVRRRIAADGRASAERIRPLGERFHRSPVLKDRRGRLWFVLDRRLLVIDGERISEWTEADDIGAADIAGLAEDAAGRILLANRDAVFEFVEGHSDRPGVFRRAALGAPGTETYYAIYAVPDGVWIGTQRGLLFWDGARPARRVNIAGLGHAVIAIHQDRQRNLWVGTAEGGLFVVPGERIASYTPAAEILPPPFRSMFESADGRMFVAADRGASEIADDRLVPVPAPLNRLATRAEGRILLDSEGHWWFGGGGTLTRAAATPSPTARHEVVLSGLTAPPGSWYGPVPHQDPQGRMWSTGPADSIYRLHPTGEGSFRPERVRLGKDAFAGKLQGDRAGNLWIISHQYVIRRRADGRIDHFEPQPGLPQTMGRALLLDSRGWIWIGLRNGGVSVTRDPGAGRPVFENVSMAQGLASNAAWALCEDRSGRIYIGSSRGLDRLDPRTGSVRHLSARDGLAAGLVSSCSADRHGDIWVTTGQGVSRLAGLDAEAAPVRPPQVYFTRVRVSGRESPVGQRGAASLSGFVVPAQDNDIALEFVAPAPGRALRYQYLVEGADTNWSEPSVERAVHLARMAAGEYRLRVRAIDEAGVVSETPAAFAFRVRPPFWQQGWFIAAALALVGSAAFGWHRLKLRQVFALERVRRQVAIDLHDDIGSGLTQIALLSEVARRGAPAPAAATLAETAALAREMRASMSDIVWAVDPRHDHLRDLVERMRDAALAMANGAGIPVDFHCEDEARIARIELGPDRRRHILLLFKEAFTNAVRHSGATRLAVEVRVEGGELRLRVADNGRGFDAGATRPGHGLHSMRTRAVEVQAVLDIDSTPGRGTTISVRVPLASKTA